MKLQAVAGPFMGRTAVRPAERSTPSVAREVEGRQKASALK